MAHTLCIIRVHKQNGKITNIYVNQVIITLRFSIILMNSVGLLDSEASSIVTNNQKNKLLLLVVVLVLLLLLLFSFKTINYLTPGVLFHIY